MPTNLFCRCCGPEKNMKYQVDPDWFEKHVEELKCVIEHIPDMPPLIVNYVKGAFELNDGNHRFEAYKRLQVQEITVIVWITEEQEYQEFVKNYAMYCENAIVIRK